jgi:hypothetical protein
LLSAIVLICQYVYELLNIQAIREQQTRIPYFSEEERKNIAENRQNDVLHNVLSANPTRCRENYRLSSVQFAKLLELIAPLIKQTRSLTHEVQLAVYLDWISYGTTLRQQKNKFKLSHESLIHCRRNVTTAIMNAVYPVYVQQINSIPLNILTNHKFRHFVGAFGCMDGCLIPLQVQSDNSAAKWRCRKNFTAINGFFISDLENMSFLLHWLELKEVVQIHKFPLEHIPKSIGPNSGFFLQMLDMLYPCEFSHLIVECDII